AFDRQVHIDNLRDGQLHQRQEDALDGFAHPRVFHRRLSYDGGRVDRVLAVRDAGDVKHRVEVLQGVEAGVIAEGALHLELVQLDVTFEDDLRIRGNFR